MMIKINKMLISQTIVYLAWLAFRKNTRAKKKWLLWSDRCFYFILLELYLISCISETYLDLPTSLA